MTTLCYVNSTLKVYIHIRIFCEENLYIYFYIGGLKKTVMLLLGKHVYDS